MTNDLTGTLKELRAAYRAYQNAKRDRKEEIREKYEARIAEETRAAVESEKYAFAKLLADRKEFFNIRVTDIQDHVLRTRNWKVWEDIRDYAEIEPEQVVRDRSRETRTKQKELLKRGFEWNSDHSVLTIYRLPDRDIPAPLVISDYRVNAHKWSVGWPMDLYRALRGEKYGHLYMPLVKYLESIFMGAFKSGEIAEREVSRDLEVIEANEARMRADNIYYLENQ